jgi:hypothetical protein
MADIPSTARDLFAVRDRGFGPVAYGRSFAALGMTDD